MSLTWKNRALVLAVLLAMAAVGHAAAPVAQSASYNEGTNILSITFDQQVMTRSGDVIIDGILIDDDDGGRSEDYAIRGGQIMNTTDQSETVLIKLMFGGVIDNWTFTDGEGTEHPFDCWGNDYTDTKTVESMLSHDEMRLFLPQYSVINADNEFAGAAWVDLDYIPYTDPTELVDVQYNALTNVIRFEFDRVVQFDQIAEDVAEDNPINPSWPGPGNGVLDNTSTQKEDRNGNGVLDMEQNVQITQIVFKDGDGNEYTLSSADDITKMDSTVIELNLPIPFRYQIELLDLSTLTVTCPTYTFVDTDYNSVLELADVPVTVIPDDAPLIADSAGYNLGDNKLTIWFNQELDTRIASNIVIPKIWIEEYSTNGTTTVVADSFYLNGGAPNLVDGNIGAEIELLVPDAHALEDMVDNLVNNPSHFLRVKVNKNAIVSGYGNGNVTTVSELMFTPESDRNKAPEASEASYNAYSNELHIVLDVRLEIDIDLSGISFVMGDDQIALTGGDATRVGGNRELLITLNQHDRNLVESHPDRATATLHVDPYSILQQTRLNGNREISGLPITYIADPTPPIPLYIWYDFYDSKLVLEATTSLQEELVDFSKLTLAGISISTPDSAITGDDDRLWVYLSSADREALNNLDDALKYPFEADIQAGFLMNWDGISSLAYTGVNDNDTLEADTVSAQILLGYGRNFWVKAWETFPTETRKIQASIRAISDHAYWYADNYMWRAIPYFNNVQRFDSQDNPAWLYNQDGMDVAPLKAEEVAACVNYFEDAVPKDSTMGAYQKLINIMAGGNADVLSEKVSFLLTDVYDDFGMDGRNDSKAQFWKHGYFRPDDLPGSGDDYCNEAELVVLDCYPQSYVHGEMAYKWYDNDSEWQLADTTMANRGLRAIANLFTNYLIYKVDEFEDEWIRVGLAYISEFIVDSPPNFYGQGEAKRLAGNNVLTFIGSDQNSRADAMFCYSFMLYLWEKYGGDDIISDIATSRRIGMEGIGTVIEDNQSTLPSYLQGKEMIDIFLDYATANLLDTTNGNDNRIYALSNVNANGSMLGTQYKWKPTSAKDRPPYHADCPDWGFNYFYSAYGTYYANELIDPINDNLSVFAGEGATNIRFRKVNLYASLDETNLGDRYQVQDFSGDNWDDEKKCGTVPMSPSDDWIFGPDYADSTNFPTWVLIAAGGGDFMVTNESNNTAYTRLFVTQNPAAELKLDFYVISGRRIYDANGVEVPFVYATSEENGGDTLAIFSEAENFESVSYLTSSDSVKFVVYKTSGWMSELSTMYWHVDGYMSNGDPITTPVVEVGTNLLPAGRPGRLELGDKLQLGTTSAAFERNVWASVVTLDDEIPEPLVAKVGNLPVDQQRVAVSETFRIDTDDAELHDPAWLTIRFDDEAAQDQPVGIYLLHQDEWVYVGGAIDRENGTISAPVSKLGTFKVMAGPLGDTPADLLVPTEYALQQNYPNPFNPTTTIGFQVPHTGQVNLTIYDVLGRQVATLVDQPMRFGSHRVFWDGRSDQGAPLSSGVYFVRMNAGSFQDVKKMVLVK